MKVALLQSGQERIEKAFQTASTTTGASFEYLVKTATRESNLDPQAKATTSTAAGTFQFIESTWLETVKQSGARFGLDKYADQIERSAKGAYVVRDNAVRQEILDLRHDPEISALMAGALTQKNSKSLENFLGRPPSDGELYIAHFLGASGAKRLIGLAESRPDADAAAYFKTQARANKPIFFDAGGTVRSAKAVYNNLVNRHDGTKLIGTALASVEPKPKPVPATNAVTLAATPLARPAALPAPGVLTDDAEPSVVDRISYGWNVVAANDDPAGLSNALQIAARDYAGPASAKGVSDRFDRVFQLADSATKPVNLSFATADLQRATDWRGDRAVAASASLVKPPQVSAVAPTAATVVEASSPAELPSRPVAAPFQAQQPKTAFESLYRSDKLAPRNAVGDAFALAYAAQTSLFSSPAADAIEQLFGQSSLPSGQEQPKRQPGMPLDLGEYSRVKPRDAQRELLPPV